MPTRRCVGGTGDWSRHLAYVLPIVRANAEGGRAYAMSGLILQSGALFICDTHVNHDPTAEQIAEMTLLAADEVRRFGVVPKGRPPVAFELRGFDVAERQEDAPRARVSSGHRLLTSRSTERCTPMRP